MSHVLIERSRSFVRVHSSLQSTQQSRIRPQLDKGDLYERTVLLVVVLGTCPCTCFPIHERALLISTRAIFLLVELHVSVLRYNRGGLVNCCCFCCYEHISHSAILTSSFPQSRNPPVAPENERCVKLDELYLLLLPLPTQLQSWWTDTSRVSGKGRIIFVCSQTLQGRVIHARLLLREFIATGWSACVEKSAYSIA